MITLSERYLNHFFITKYIIWLKCNLQKSKHNLNDNDTSETFIEVWTHENCLVWASGVYMVGDKIVGLEDSVRIAKNTVSTFT